MISSIKYKQVFKKLIQINSKKKKLESIFKLCHLLTFQEKNKLKEVELSAIWGLSCALKANLDFSIICQSFTNMVLVALRNCNTFHCLALEIHSLRYCHKKVTNIEADDLKYVAELYYAIRGLRFMWKHYLLPIIHLKYFRSYRSELEKAIYIGYISLRLAISVNHLKLVLKVIPSLVLTLMFKSYLPEACSLINELDYYSSESDCNSIQSGI